MVVVGLNPNLGLWRRKLTFPLPAELRHRAAAAQRRRVHPPAARGGGEKGGGAIAHQLHGSAPHPGENPTRAGRPASRGLL